MNGSRFHIPHYQRFTTNLLISETMTIAKPSSSQVNATVTKFYEAVTAWDFDALETLFSEDYEHRTLPASANDPPKDKKQGIEFARAIGQLLGHAKLNYEIFKSIELPGSVWAHTRLYGELRGGHQFNGESIYIFTLSSEGDRIVGIQEFIDTKAAADFAAASAPAQQ